MFQNAMMKQEPKEEPPSANNGSANAAADDTLGDFDLNDIIDGGDLGDLGVLHRPVRRQVRFRL